MNFYSYFLPPTPIVLENVSYEAIKIKKTETMQYKMSCKDTILAQLMANGVKINFNRKVDFDPESLFCLSVTFSVFFPFREGAGEEREWKSVDIAGEFKAAGGPVLNSLMAKTSLLVGNITGAAGNPLITPAGPTKPNA